MEKPKSLKHCIKPNTNVIIATMPKSFSSRNLVKMDILVPSNSDLVIKGIGFIRFKSASFIGINLNADCYEIRPTIIGGNHE